MENQNYEWTRATDVCVNVWKWIYGGENYDHENPQVTQNK